MADFIAFGSAVADMAKKCSGCADRRGVADLLVRQNKLIQEKRIQDRLSGASAGGQGAGSGNGHRPAASDPAVTGAASGAMARMMAELGRR